MTVLLLRVIYNFFRLHIFDKKMFAEILIVPLLFASATLITNSLVGDRFEYLFQLNKEKVPEEFQNPFLSYQMRDCRRFTKDFDVIFVPQRIDNEGKYLAYAPRREDKSNNYRFGKKFNDNWYIEFSGSVWDEKLRKCYFQKETLFK